MKLASTSSILLTTSVTHVLSRVVLTALPFCPVLSVTVLPTMASVRSIHQCVEAATRVAPVMVMSYLGMQSKGNAPQFVVMDWSGCQNCAMMATLYQVMGVRLNVRRSHSTTVGANLPLAWSTSTSPSNPPQSPRVDATVSECQLPSTPSYLSLRKLTCSQ